MAQYQIKIDVKFEGKRVYTPFALRNTEKDARLLAEKILHAALTDDTGVEKVRLTLPDGTKYYPSLKSLTGKKVTVTGTENPRAKTQNHVAITLRAPNDRNGNPRQLAMIFKAGNGGELVGVDKYSYGSPELLGKFGLSSIVMVINISSKDLAGWITLAKNRKTIAYNESA